MNASAPCECRRECAQLHVCTERRAKNSIHRMVEFHLRPKEEFTIVCSMRSSSSHRAWSIGHVSRKIFLVFHAVGPIYLGFCMNVIDSAGRVDQSLSIQLFRLRSYLVHAHLFESTLENFEILNVFVFQIGTKFDTLHWNGARKQHIHVLTISGSWWIWKE